MNDFLVYVHIAMVLLSMTIFIMAFTVPFTVKDFSVSLRIYIAVIISVSVVEMITCGIILNIFKYNQGS